MTSCHPGCDRCDLCDAHIFADEPRLDIPAVTTADGGDRAYHFHFDCAPDQWDDEGPHLGCREFIGEAMSAYAAGQRRVRGCITWQEESNSAHSLVRGPATSGRTGD